MRTMVEDWCGGEGTVAALGLLAARRRRLGQRRLGRRSETRPTTTLDDGGDGGHHLRRALGLGCGSGRTPHATIRMLSLTVIQSWPAQRRHRFTPGLSPGPAPRNISCSTFTTRALAGRGLADPAHRRCGAGLPPLRPTTTSRTRRRPRNPRLGHRRAGRGPAWWKPATAGPPAAAPAGYWTLLVLLLLGDGIKPPLGRREIPPRSAGLPGSGRPAARVDRLGVRWPGRGGAAVHASRGVVVLVLESLRFRRTDLTWFARWPMALVTGRFGRARGSLRPRAADRECRPRGLLLLAVTASVYALARRHGGPGIGHRRAAAALVDVPPDPAARRTHPGRLRLRCRDIAGCGGLMHLGGRLPASVAQRVWPGWTRQKYHCC